MNEDSDHIEKDLISKFLEYKPKFQFVSAKDTDNRFNIVNWPLVNYAVVGRSGYVENS